MNKKRISLLLLIVFSASIFSFLPLLTACSSNRENVLRIANQGEYMDPEMYEAFEEWYFEQTGEEVTVEYKEFDTCENLYTWIARKHEDYDLICPSDYMLQRMRTEGLLLRLDDETIAVLEETISPFIIDLAKSSYDPEFAYSMPYLWGTLGIMFNTNSDGEEGIQNELETMNSWNALWSEQNKNKIFMKDSVRDAYSVAMLYAKRDELTAAYENFGYDSDEYRTVLHEIFDSSSKEKVELAHAALMDQKQYVYDYEVDSAKDELLRDIDGKKGLFGLFWSCDAGYIMTGDSDEDTNKNLYYTVPKEGGNVWIDGFAISKYAANTKAANLFLQYLCDPDVAYANMDYTGTTTAVQEAADQYKADLIDDEDGFFEDTYDGFKEMYLEMLFPSDAIIEGDDTSNDVLLRCAVMKDLGVYNNDLNEMWIDILLS